MGQPEDMDQLLRTELGRTSSFQPQRFYDILRNADPALLREVLPTAVPATQFFLCKQAAELPDSDRKVEIALVLADELSDEQVAGVDQVIRSLSHHFRGKFIRRAIEIGNLSCRKAALGLAVRDRAKHLIPKMIELWDTCDADHRVLLSDTLFKLGGMRTTRFLRKMLGKESQKEVILAMLCSSLKQNRHKAFYRNYRTYSKHPDPEVRFRGIQGLAEKLSWWEYKGLLRRLPGESDLRNFNLIGRVLLSRPSPYLAESLFTLANGHPVPKFREAATRQFRRIPERILQPFCLQRIRDKDQFKSIFVIREMAFSDSKVICATLMEIAQDPSFPVQARNMAIEGLTFQRGTEVIDLLFELQYDKKLPQLLRYSALTTLTKLCDETHLERMLPMLVVDDKDHALPIQALLTFLQRKIRAKKVRLPPRASEQLCTIVFQGTNHNCRYLALSTLLTCRPNTSLQPFLKFAAQQLSPYLRDMLSAFLATRLQAETDMFLSWLFEEERNIAEIKTGLNAILKTTGEPDSDPTIFVNLLSWPPGQRNQELRPIILACLHHLLRSPETSSALAEHLPEVDEVLLGLLSYANELPLKDLKSFAHDPLIAWVSANPTAPVSSDLIPIIAEFKTEASRACLISLFRWSESLREHISNSLKHAIVKV